MVKCVCCWMFVVSCVLVVGCLLLSCVRCWLVLVVCCLLWFVGGCCRLCVVCHMLVVVGMVWRLLCDVCCCELGVVRCLMFVCALCC